MEKEVEEEEKVELEGIESEEGYKEDAEIPEEEPQSEPEDGSEEK